MHSNIIKNICFIVFALSFGIYKISIAANNSPANNVPPQFLEILLKTKSYDEFANILKISNTDLVNASQRKSTIDALCYYNGNELGDILLRPGQLLNSAERFGFNEQLNLSINTWRDGIVPYYISSAYAGNETDFIKNEIDYNNKLLGPNVNFRPYEDGDTDYVMFFNGGCGCYTNLGNVGGPQVVSLNSLCVDKGFISRELQHTLGIPYQSNRIDRDNYIQPITENIPEVFNAQYEKYTSDNIVNSGTFDYYSIVLYPVLVPGYTIPAFKVLQGGIDTSTLGHQTKLSPADIERVKALYN